MSMRFSGSLAAALCGSVIFFSTGAFAGGTESSSLEEEYIETVQSWARNGELNIMPTMHWEVQKEFKIVYRSPEKNMVSFRIWHWAYTGGAHGMPDTVVGTFHKGKRLTLKDIAPTASERRRLEKAWQAAIARYFKKESFEAYIKSKPFFKPFMTKNFFLDDKGITFVYNPYEIGSFAAGTIDITIPWKFEKSGTSVNK